MGYYADLIKAKQNAKEEKDNGKVFETWDEAIKWIESQGYEVDSVNRTRPSKWVICYKGEYEYEVEFAKLTYRGGEVNYEVMGRISKTGPRNSKEEKDNESTVEKFDHYGSNIEIIKTDSGNFRYRVSKKGKFKESMSVSTRAEAMRDAIKDAETWANSKEEKDNSLIGLFEPLRPKDEKTVKEYIRQVKNFIRQCEAKSERSDYAKDYRDLNKRSAESYKKEVEKAERWLSENHNSDEEKGYYAKLAEEKASRKH